MRNPIQKKLIFLSIIILILVIFFIIFVRQKDNKTINSGAKNEGTVIGIPLPSAENQLAPRDTTDESKSNAANPADLSYNFLVQNPNAVAAIRKILPGFKPSDMFVSTPISSTKLPGGEYATILWGCEEHNCGGTTLVVAYIQSKDIAYVLTEKTTNEKNYEILDDPPQEIRDILIKFYKI